MCGMDSWSHLVPALDAAAADRISAALLAAEPAGDDTADLEARRVRALRWQLSLTVWDNSPSYEPQPEILRIAAGPLPWREHDLGWAIHMIGKASIGYDGLPFHLPVMIAEQIPAPWLNGFAPALTALLDHIDDCWDMPADMRRALGERYGQLLARLTGGMPPHILSTRDAFGTTALDRLGPLRADPAVIGALRFARTLTKPVPPRSWLRQATAVLADEPRVGDAVRRVLAVFTETAGGVHEVHDPVLRGLCWMASTDPGAETTALLARVAEVAGSASGRGAYARAPRAAAAAVEILPERQGAEPARALARLSLTARSKPVRSRVGAALERMATVRGWKPGEVLELAIDDHGLGADGCRTWPASGGHTLAVEIIEERAVVRARRAGSPLRSIPAEVRGDDALIEAKALAKEINKTLAAERGRIEDLLSADRVWGWDTWRQRYLDHPVTGTIGRRLIWQVSTDRETWTTGLPEHGDSGEPSDFPQHGDSGGHVDGPSPSGSGGSVDGPERDGSGGPVNGPERDGSDGTVSGFERGDFRWTVGGRSGPELVVRLWHPVLADPAEVAGWRDRITEAGLRQPFKQAFREVYRLTPAEEQTRLYSNRFAGHILRYRQANALMRVRGWSASFLGTWDGGYDSEAVKELGGGWQASFRHEAVEADGYQVEFCSTDQVRFARRDGRRWESAPMAGVPVRVLSEAMRDVDLFIGVTSIAADESWTDRGEDGFGAYWSRVSFGDLSGSAEIRRDVLARLLPRLKIGPACELTDRFLKVRGTRAVYKIHLGSANILMEPDDSYLCIVPDRRQARVSLPFDDDERLSLILSKALLLAADDRITDPTILRQLPR